MPDGSYYAVIVQEHQDPFLLEFKTSEELANAVKQFIGTRTYAFPFYGLPCAITKGPTRRYLVDAVDGKRFPLFTEEPNHEIDRSGSLYFKEE